MHLSIDKEQSNPKPSYIINRNIFNMAPEYVKVKGENCEGVK